MVFFAVGGFGGDDGGLVKQKARAEADSLRE
jgi:hypothetical protein